MFGIDSIIVNLAAALGSGLLIGAERERHKRVGPSRSAAGVRTFAITSLAGAVAIIVGGKFLLTVITAGIVVLAAIAYWRNRDDDPGITSEVALIVTALLGGFSIQNPVLAAALAVTVTILLAARSPMHRFVRAVLNEDEVRDALIFAGATLILLPLLPDRPIGPFEALNLHTVWIVAILVMAVGAAGHVAVRVLGMRFGLPIAGLASGFISSTATIAALGGRTKKTPELLRPAVAGAVLSTVATIVQMVIVLTATSTATLSRLLVPLICAGAAAVLYGAIFMALALRQKIEDQVPAGRAFSLSASLIFAILLATIMMGSAALRDLYGEAGVIAASALAGFADTHAAAISVASLVVADKMTVSDVTMPILAALSTNTASKIIVAIATGGRPFAIRVVPGLVIVALAGWAAALIGKTF